MQSFLVALAFLSVIPIRFREMPDEKAVARSRFWYPVIGVLLGVILAGWTLAVMQFTSPMIGAFLVLAAWVLLTGALHIDGFCDLSDGLLGGRTPEDRLRIMKDPTRGTFAIVGCVLLLLGKFIALMHLLTVKWYSLPPLVIATAFAQARCLVLCMAANAPYPRKEGTGKVVVEATRFSDGLLGTALAAAILLAMWSLAGQEIMPDQPLNTVLMSGGLAICLFVVPALLAVLVLRFFCLRRLGGVTGDCLGAAIELSELVFLLGTAIAVVLAMREP